MAKQSAVKANKKIGNPFQRIISFDEDKPYSVLGPQLDEDNKELSINCYLPFAEKVWIKRKGKKLTEAEKINPSGIFSAKFENTTEIFPYKIVIESNGNKSEFEDPYYYRTEITDMDVYLLGEGNHFKSWEKLGAHKTSIKGVRGVIFRIWVPDVKAVSITGEFNDWTEGLLPMENCRDTGYWTLFLPGVKEGDLYKYAIKTKSPAKVIYKSDPYAFSAELRPGNASKVAVIDKYKWKDTEWMKTRRKYDYRNQPMNIYEVHLGSWKKDYDNPDFKNDWGYKSYKQLAYELVEHCKTYGYTHIELLPIMEHPLDASWGYQVTGFFAPTSRYGSPEDFMLFVDHCHQNNIGVILDWVPGHFPSDEHGLNNFNGKQIYAYTNPKKGFHNGWGTYVFDYAKTEVTNFLIANALFWLKVYHIDGLRVDAVASMLYLDYCRNEGEWEPNELGGKENLEAVAFLKKLNDTVHKYHKGTLMIAEESTDWQGVTKPTYLGGLGFDMKWNMGWMHDVLEYFSKDPIYRKYFHNKITFSLWYSFNENYLLPISHDEVVHLKKALVSKMPGQLKSMFSNMRTFFGFMFGHPGKKLNFMTNDIGQFHEWNADTAMQWDVLNEDLNVKLQKFFKDLSSIYHQYRAFYEIDFRSDGFHWLDFTDSDNSVLSFVRYSADKKQMLLFTFNMTPVHRKDYEFGTPRAGFYREILNSDAVEYGGTGEGNLGGIHTEDRYKFQWPYTIKVNLPPLAVNIFIHELEDEFTQEVKTDENKTEQIEDDKQEVQEETNEEQNDNSNNEVNETTNEETQTISPEEIQTETQKEVSTETDAPEIINKETEQPN